MSDDVDRAELMRKMAAKNWREALGSVAYELIRANNSVGEAIDRFTDSQVRQARAAHKLSRAMLYLTFAIAGAAVLQGLGAFIITKQVLWASGGGP